MSSSSKTPAKKATERFRRGASRSASGSHGGGLRRGEKPIRKNYYLYQSKVELAKEILGAKTETEAVDGALDVLIYGEALARGTESMAGEEYNDVLGIAGEAPGSGESA